MRIKPITHQGYELLHDGSIMLAQMEANGIRIDVGYLKRTMEEVQTNSRDLYRQLTERSKENKVWRLWKRRFGDKAKLGSSEQLGEVLYKDLDFPVLSRTEKGAPSTDEEALQQMDLPYLKTYLKWKKFGKLETTYLRGVMKEVVDGYIHPFFNLHRVITYRSSCDSPNFQNIPIRNPELGRLIRRAIIPRKGRALVETDFKGMEVCVAACYNRDRRLIEYISDPTKDMHRDMAAQIYFLKPSEVGKQHRYAAKNKFIFPQFYGSFFPQCAADLWEWIDRADLRGPKGEPLKEHLKKYGIRERGTCDVENPQRIKGTFEAHIADVEDDFWGNRFAQYARWKRRWFKDYLRNGGFDTLSGFRIEGSFRRNAVVNYPVQGSAFHCLLWSLIRAQRLLTKREMETLLIGQIHDSSLADVPPGELRDYVAMMNEIAAKDLPAHYKWICVPMTVETEISRPGSNWFEKKPVELQDDGFHFGGKVYEPEDPTKLFANLLAA